MRLTSAPAGRTRRGLAAPHHRTATPAMTATSRVRLLRNVAHRPDLTEGAVCDLAEREAAALIAARLAEAVESEPEPLPPTPAPVTGARCAPLAKPDKRAARAR